jgi:hypothetical protein
MGPSPGYHDNREREAANRTRHLTLKGKAAETVVRVVTLAETGEPLPPRP